MKQKFKNVISVLWSLLRLSLIKLIHWRGCSFRLVERISPSVRIDLVRGGLRLGRRVRIHHGTKLLVNGGTLTIQDDVAINQNCGIYCFEQIEIGSQTEFGPGVMVYDHDHDFRCEGGLKAGKYRVAPVKIGKSVWIGANSIILRGSVIGDGCVIGAGSIICGEVPAHTVLVQKRTEELRPI